MEEPKTRKKKLLKYKQATNLDFRESTYTQIFSLRLRATSSAGFPSFFIRSLPLTLSQACVTDSHTFSLSPLSLSLSFSPTLSVLCRICLLNFFVQFFLSMVGSISKLGFSSAEHKLLRKKMEEGVASKTFSFIVFCFFS